MELELFRNFVLSNILAHSRLAYLSHGFLGPKGGNIGRENVETCHFPECEL